MSEVKKSDLYNGLEVVYADRYPARILDVNLKGSSLVAIAYVYNTVEYCREASLDSIQLKPVVHCRNVYAGAFGNWFTLRENADTVSYDEEKRYGKRIGIMTAELPAGCHNYTNHKLESL
jgi:hypothetical protein